MACICQNCQGPKPDHYHRACEKCRAKWRKDKKPKAKEFWLVFTHGIHKDAVTCAAFGHNPVADYRGLPNYIGYRKITVDMENLQT